MSLSDLSAAIAIFSFGYPLVMGWYWIGGALMYVFMRERHEPDPEHPPVLPAYPPVSILIPCFNETAQLEETLAGAALQDYPDFEIIAIDDGSTDGTGAALDRLAENLTTLRVVHLAGNQGKSSALNAGALAARHEILVCIDGDAMLDRHVLTWFVRRFQCLPELGAVTGNPRIRNRGSLLGRMQVGEFSSIVGLVKRAQTAYGSLFTVSGVICAFRKRALQDAGWWTRGALTDDVDISWCIQLAGWRISFEPKALCWILMPETLGGLWRQRLRWSEGGTRVMLDMVPALLRASSARMWIPWVNAITGLAWAYTIAFAALWKLAAVTGLLPAELAPDFSAVPVQWAAVLGLTYLTQALVSGVIDERYERGMLRALFWVVWYPVAFWALQASAAIVGVPRALARSRHAAGTWISPDRGFR